MKLSAKYILFAVLIHAALITLSIPFLFSKPWIFIIAEVFILASIIISIRLYRSLIRPVKLIGSGIETIKGKDFSSTLLKVGQPEMDQLIEVYNKMIDQLREERIIHAEQNLFLEKLINASPSAIIILNPDNKIRSINPAAELMIGIKHDDIFDKSPAEIHHIFFNSIKNLKEGESQIIKLSGIKTLKVQKAHFVDRGSKHYFLLIEELTEEIRLTEKQSYGKIIRMMSHEINNSIGAINSIMNSFLNYGSQLNNEDRNDFEDAIHVAIDRNNRLNKFMGNFADVVRIPMPVKTKWDLNKLVTDVISLMAPLCDSANIKIEFTPDQFNRDVLIDVQQIEQVLVNILKNSIESIESSGKIKIEIFDKVFPVLVISDNGKGIPDDVRENLFSPFFSTKPNGQGIGLTLIREILINHKFEFSLQTKEDGITEFQIVFK